MTDTEGSTITRTFAAPPDLVFDAWVTPEHFAAWFGGSGVVVPIETVEMDVRPGGAWKATMDLGAPGQEIFWRGEFLEIDRPSHLRLTLSDRDDAHEFVDVTFTEVDGGTEMHFQQSGGNLSPEEYERTTAGWNGFFDALGELVTAAA